MESRVKENPLEIAIIGSGLAGLSAANLLSRNHHVTILEKAPSIGMDLASVSVPDSEGKEIRIDSPMRGITKSYYPTLFQFYKYLGIKVRKSYVDASFMEWQATDNAGNSNQNQNSVFFTSNFSKMNTTNGIVSLTRTSTYLSGFQDYIPSMTLFPILLRDFFFNSKFSLQAGFEIMRLYLHAINLAANKQIAFVEGTFEQWLNIHYFSKDIQALYLVPFLSGMGTCSKNQILEYPASVILHMIANWGDETYQVVGGVRNVVAKLLEPVSEIVFNCEISGVWKDATNGKILIIDSNGYKRYFDKIVFAGAAHTARNIIMATPPAGLAAINPDPRVLSALSKFSFLPVRVIVHTDSSILPKDKKDWRAINFAIDKKRDAMATLWINYMQNINGPDYFETSSIFVSPEPEIASSKIISEHVFPRSLVTKDTNLGIDELELLQGVNDMYFIGSWSWPGMPLLEGCVTSAIRISERLGLPRPWNLQSESASWCKEDDFLGKSLVERYLNDDLSATDRNRGFVVGIISSFLLLYLQIALLVVTKILGIRQALSLAYQPPLGFIQDHTVSELFSNENSEKRLKFE